MPDLLTLTCPTCGAKLKVTDKVHILACASCGNEHMVHRDGGAIYLAPMAEDVRQIRVSADKTAAELAIARLSKEIHQLEIEARDVASLPTSQLASENPNSAILKKTSLLLFGIAFVLFMLNVRFVAFVALFAGSACIIAVSVFNVSHENNAEKVRQERISNLKSAIASKNAEMSQNRSIVENTMVTTAHRSAA